MSQILNTNWRRAIIEIVISSFFIGFIMNFQTFLFNEYLILSIKGLTILFAFVTLIRRIKFRRFIFTTDFFTIILFGLVYIFSYANLGFKDNYYSYKVLFLFYNIVIPYLVLTNFFFYFNSQIIKKNFFKGFIFGGLLSIIIWIVSLNSILINVAIFSHLSRFEYSRTLINPIWLSRIAFSISLVMIYYFARINKLSKLIKLTLIIVTIIIGFITYSRGPIIAFIFSLIISIILILKKRKFSINPKVIIVLLIVAILLLANWGNLFFNSFFAELNKRFLFESLLDSTRIDLWEYSIKTWEKGTVFFGNGPYRFSNTIKYPHNIMFEILSETGIFGITLFIIFCYFVIKRSSFVLLVLFIFYFICALFSGDLNSNYQLFWIAACSSIYISKNNKSTKCYTLYDY